MKTEVLTQHKCLKPGTVHNRLCVGGILARHTVMMDAACGVKHNRQEWGI